MFVLRFLFSVFIIFDHILGCRLETTWHKMDPVQRESAALIPTSVSDSYMFCPRCFTNLMCIICKSCFVELCPRTLLLHVAVYENTGKLHTVQFVSASESCNGGGGAFRQASYMCPYQSDWDVA